jgi:hypothetical protein
LRHASEGIGTKGCSKGRCHRSCRGRALLCFVLALVGVNIERKYFPPGRRLQAASDASRQLAEQQETADLDAWLQATAIQSDRSRLEPPGKLSGEYLIFVTGPYAAQDLSQRLPCDGLASHFINVHGGMLDEDSEPIPMNPFSSKDSFFSYYRGDLASRIVVIQAYAEYDTSQSAEEWTTTYSKEGREVGSSGSRNVTLSAKGVSAVVTVFDRKSMTILAQRDFPMPGEWIQHCGLHMSALSHATEWISGLGMQKARWLCLREDRLPPPHFSFVRLFERVFGE